MKVKIAERRLSSIKKLAVPIAGFGMRTRNSYNAIFGFSVDPDFRATLMIISGILDLFQRLNPYGDA